jgi:hypothetical protein
MQKDSRIKSKLRETRKTKTLIYTVKKDIEKKEISPASNGLLLAQPLLPSHTAWLTQSLLPISSHATAAA